MNDLWYLVHTNILLILLGLVFFGLYQKDKNFAFNRYYLLGGIVLSVVLPTLKFDLAFLSSWDPVLVDFVKAPAVALERLTEGNTGEFMLGATPLPKSQGVATFALLLKLAFAFYWAGVFLLLTRFFIQIGSLLHLLWRIPRLKREGYYLLHTDQDIAPFSFFKWVLINPEKYDQEQYELILRHEQVHVRSWHNVDLLLGELLTIFFWINPLAWSYKKAIRDNLEFLADEEVLQGGVERKSYQYSLLSTKLTHYYHPAIANHFNKSLLKQRIIMMNTKKSTDCFSIKHLLLLPLFALLLSGSLPLLAQSDGHRIGSYAPDVTMDGTPVMQGETVIGVVTSHLTMEGLQAMKQEFAKRGIELEYSQVNFSAEGKLARIKMQMQMWSGDPIIAELDNGKDPIEGKIVAFFKHKKGDKNASMGMTQGVPEGFKEEDIRLTRQLSGIAVRTRDNQLIMQGRFELD